MLEHIATLAYAQIHDGYLALKKELGTDKPCHLGQKRRTADAKLTLPEAACLAVLFQSSGQGSLKQFLAWHARELALLFPGMPGYGRVSKWLPKAEQLLLALAKMGLAAPGGRESVYLVDSTKVDPHKLKNNPKCLRRKVGYGHTHEGGYIGLKLHVAANRWGRIVAFDVSPGNRHDLDPVKGGLLKGLSGIAFADSGYVSEQVRQNLKSQDLALVAKPTPAMADSRWIFDKIWAKAYRQRQVVEGVFSRLKTKFGLLAHSVRSAATLRSRILASIVAYELITPAAMAS